MMLPSFMTGLATPTSPTPHSITAKGGGHTRAHLLHSCPRDYALQIPGVVRIRMTKLKLTSVPLFNSRDFATDVMGMRSYYTEMTRSSSCLPLNKLDQG